MNYVDRLASLNACPKALRWLREANHSTLQEAWAACPHADWLLWLLGVCANRITVENPRDIVIIVADLATGSMEPSTQASKKPGMPVCGLTGCYGFYLGLDKQESTERWPFVPVTSQKMCWFT